MSEKEEETKKQPEVVTEEEEGGEEGENAPAVVPEEESTATFEPVVQLEAVEIQTGEEEEELLYEQRAKLFLYNETLLNVGTGNKTWNERGVGSVRILKHKEHSRIRVLMRQEKTHKIIINHALLPGLTLVPHTTSDRAIVWRAEDFSDGETLKETDFCLRFADTNILAKFKEAFTKYQKEMEDLYGGLDQGDQADADEAAAALNSLSVTTNDNSNNKKEETSD